MFGTNSREKTVKCLRGDGFFFFFFDMGFLISDG